MADRSSDGEHSLPVLKLSSPATHEYWEIPVLFEDEHLLAISKPAGLLSSPDRYDAERPNLMKLLHEAIAAQKPWAAQRGLTYLMNAHRLDFGTSGILLLAKTRPVLVALANLFGNEKPLKKYAALVEGVPAENDFEVDAALAPHPFKPGRMRVDTKKGKRSLTRFHVAERFSQWALLECEPLTGRTHQIRVHLRCRDLPVVADELYGGRTLMLSRLKRDYAFKRGETEKPLINRVALHAERLSLTHPMTNQTILITAPWPRDLTVAVKYLRRYAPAAL